MKLRSAPPLFKPQAWGSARITTNCRHTDVFLMPSRVCLLSRCRIQQRALSCGGGARHAPGRCEFSKVVSWLLSIAQSAEEVFSQLDSQINKISFATHMNALSTKNWRPRCDLTSGLRSNRLSLSSGVLVQVSIATSFSRYNPLLLRGLFAEKLTRNPSYLSRSFSSPAGASDTIPPYSLLRASLYRLYYSLNQYQILRRFRFGVDLRLEEVENIISLLDKLDLEGGSHDLYSKPKLLNQEASYPSLTPIKEANNKDLIIPSL